MKKKLTLTQLAAAKEIMKEQRFAAYTIAARATWPADYAPDAALNPSPAQSWQVHPLVVAAIRCRYVALLPLCVLPH